MLSPPVVVLVYLPFTHLLFCFVFFFSLSSIFYHSLSLFDAIMNCRIAQSLAGLFGNLATLFLLFCLLFFPFLSLLFTSHSLSCLTFFLPFSFPFLFFFELLFLHLLIFYILFPLLLTDKQLVNSIEQKMNISSGTKGDGRHQMVVVKYLMCCNCIQSALTLFKISLLLCFQIKPRKTLTCLTSWEVSLYLHS